MSVSALTWAFAQEIHPATHKFVLVALADYANEEWQAYPSIAALEKKICLERRAIFYALEDLKTRGFVEPTGERKGITKQINVYQLKGCMDGNCLSGKGAFNALEGCTNGNSLPEESILRLTVKEPHPLPPQGGSLFPELSLPVPRKRSRTVKDSPPNEDFLLFWDAYPRKQKMKDAWKAWQQMNPPLSIVLESLAEHKKTEQWRRGKQFIPCAGTWIRGEQWDDEL